MATSIRSACARARTPSALMHTARTLKSGCASSSCSSPQRTAGWSSTTIRRTCFGACSLAPLRSSRPRPAPRFAASIVPPSSFMPSRLARTRRARNGVVTPSSARRHRGAHAHCTGAGCSRKHATGLLRGRGRASRCVWRVGGGDVRPDTVAARRRLYLLARVVVARHYRRRLTLAVVAGALASSPRQLQRAYAQFGEVSFHEDLLARRMAAAAVLLLEQPAIAIADVARLVGYRQPSHFARAFRRRYGLAPAGFRERARKNGTHRGAARATPGRSHPG